VRRETAHRFDEHRTAAQCAVSFSGADVNDKSHILFGLRVILAG